MLPLRFEAYNQLADTPNAVVDGAACDSTRLTLSHWPGSPTPAAVLDDLSAQIAFRALEYPEWFDGVEVVSNNHYDQDGLCGAYVLTDPEAASERRALVVDVASAGDFGTWSDRNAARLAMALAAYDDPEMSPLGPTAFEGDYGDRVGLLYRSLLPRLTDLLDHPASVAHLWADEDVRLQSSIDAIADGTIRIDEDTAVDLAVVVVPSDWADHSVHRFTGRRDTAVHPLALNNATACTRLLTLVGDRVQVEQRYESWVQYPSRAISPRQDLQLLAVELTGLEPAGAVWRADAPSSITPTLTLAAGTSRLAPEQVVATAKHFFATAAQAWDPSQSR